MTRPDSYKITIVLTLLCFGLLTACRATADREPIDLVIPTVNATGSDTTEATTVPPATPTLRPTTAAAATVTGAATATSAATATAVPLTATPLPTLQTGPNLYRVAFVAANDVLNVRAGPGANQTLVGSLPPTAAGIQLTGPGQLVAGSTWAPIVANNVRGWVNSRFLTEVVDAAAFCRDQAVITLLQELQTALAERNAGRLAQLVHPERGLRVRRHWWNPEVRLSQDEVANLFTNQTSYEWGVADGSGEPIEGSFSQIILPLLDRNLPAATQSGCNEILHGGTAGLVQLPDGYQPLNFYSFYRPGTAEYGELDWGAWVAGIERWQGRYYISYLVHYEWEI